MKISAWILAGFVVAVLVPGVANAQTITATVKGRVVDATGGGLPGVLLTAREVDGRLTRTATTDQSGDYVLLNLIAGTYDLEASLSGFTTQSRKAQTFYVGTTITIDFSMEVASLQESVEVIAAAPVLETSKNTLSRTIEQGELDSLPTVNRNFNTLAALAPGVTNTGIYGGVDIGGNRDFQNAYQVDGVSAERQALGDQRTIFSQDWIQEFQVIAHLGNAEFGNASGGVLNAITKSGGNRYTGRLYVFFRDDALDSKPAFTTQKPPLEQRRFGATFGGPLRRDKLFLFAGLERFSDESSNVVNSTYAAVNGVVPREDRQTLLIGKVDYRPSSANNLGLRYNEQRRSAAGFGIGGTSSEEHGTSFTQTGTDVIASWQLAPSSSLLNELRVARNTWRPVSRCNFAESHALGTLFERNYPGALLGCPTGYGESRENQLQLVDTLSVLRGRHEFKFGIQAQHTRTFGDFRNFRDGRYSFQADVFPFSLDSPASYPSAFRIFEGPTTWNLPAWSIGGFAQDAWRITRDLTLNLGIRYDVDGSYTALNGFVRPDRGLLHPIKRDLGNVAPRIGAAWTPFDNDRRTVLRGGFGVYYDQNHNNVTNILLLNNILTDRIVELDANSPFLNPFWPDVVRARRFLAEALAQDRIPDASVLNTVVAGSNDIIEDVQIPGSGQANGGVAHDFGRGVSLSADVAYTRGFDQYIIREINIAQDTFQRINPNYTSIVSFQSDGYFSYRALMLGAAFNRGASMQAKVSYTLAKNTSNTRSILSGFTATNPYDSSEDFGPTDYDVRHTLAANGTVMLPLGVQLSGLLTTRSALPYSASSATQLDADPWPDRPEPKNARRGDSFVSLDVRLAKVVRWGNGRSITGFVEAFNVTSAMNLRGEITTLTSTRFGEPTAAGARRQLQIGFRADF